MTFAVPFSQKFVLSVAGAASLQMAAAATGFAITRQPSAELPSETTQPAQTAPPVSPVKPGDITTADQLLDALETADAGLHTLTADIRYDRVFEIAGDRQIRDGSLVYVDTRGDAAGAPGAAGGRKFAIRIKSVQIGDRKDPEDRQLIFDGQWFVERVDSNKSFTKRRVARPGENFNPLRLGEGPFPLPIGQKKADILKRYDVDLFPATKDLVSNDPGNAAAQKSLEDFVKGCYQLKLTPKPTIIESEELKEIRLWYRPGTGNEPTLLPRMARTINRAQDVTLVQLINVKLNQPIDPESISTTPPKGDWHVQIDDLPPAGAPDSLVVPGKEPANPQTGETPATAPPTDK
ncbi:MAG: hypothetical protein WC718_04655 [Phycisphaerales bacterium]|jgi:hypothetical protein